MMAAQMAAQMVNKRDDWMVVQMVGHLEFWLDMKTAAQSVVKMAGDLVVK